MAQEGLRIPVVSYDDLRGISHEFLKQQHPSGVLPIPIEKIIDNDLKINITCEPSLQHICGVDAFVSASCDTIYIDGGVYLSANANRLRFSLAHELAHILLHRDVIGQLKFKTMREWLDAQETISKEDNAWLEWQAHSLAGLILVPMLALKARYSDIAQHVKNTRGDGDFVRSVVEQTLSEDFGVSVDVIQRRCTKDGLGA